MSEHHPMQSCKDFIGKPRYRNQGMLSQCFVCQKTFIVVIGSMGSAFWTEIKGEQK